MIMIPKNNHLSKIGIDSIQIQIDELEKLDRQKVSIKSLKKRISKLMEGYSCYTRIVDAEYAFRARINSSKKFFTNVGQLWYPPSDKINKYGRLNRPKQSLFYIAASQDTAILEMRPQKGDILTILRCKLINSNKKPHVMELGGAEKFSQHKIQSTINLFENTNTGRRYLGSKENIEKNRKIRSFLAREFTRIIDRGKEHEFKITVAIADILMSSNNIDGVEYPSIAGDVENWRGGMNMALKPSSADSLYKAYHCWVSQVEETPEERIDGKFLMRCIGTAKSISNSGKITWN